MKYGFIGCGNMGGAIAKALCHKTKSILLSDRSGKGAPLAAALGCEYANTEYVVSNCERIFLAVKPQGISTVLKDCKNILIRQKPLIITMAAGVEIRQIEECIGTRLPVIRIMPNTPVSVGRGMIPYCCNGLVDRYILEDFLSDMEYAGTWDLLDEKLMDAASALSGSGPAYMYVFLEALADGAVACGFPRDKAIRYAAATMSGAAEMVLQSDAHPASLKDAVCSPGGSTIVGLKALESHNFRCAAMDCICVAYEKNKSLGK